MEDFGVGRHRLLTKGYAALAGGSLPLVLDSVSLGFRAAGGVSPGLIMAYGWIFPWLDGKGDKRFWTGLSRMIPERADTRFVADKPAKVLPPTSTCTLLEAATHGGVTQRVMRDILVQKGLLGRPEEHGRPIRTAETEIRAIEAVTRGSVDVARAAILLGMGGRW